MEKDELEQKLEAKIASMDKTIEELTKKVDELTAINERIATAYNDEMVVKDALITKIRILDNQARTK